MSQLFSDMTEAQLVLNKTSLMLERHMNSSCQRGSNCEYKCLDKTNEADMTLACMINNDLLYSFFQIRNVFENLVSDFRANFNTIYLWVAAWSSGTILACHALVR